MIYDFLSKQNGVRLQLAPLVHVLNCKTNTGDHLN